MKQISFKGFNNCFVWFKVKRIARRYKTQVDEQTKEMEDLKKKVNESEQQEGAGKAVGTAAPSAGNVDVAEYENKIKELTEQVNNSEEEVKRLKELDEQNKVRQFSRLCKWAVGLVMLWRKSEPVAVEADTGALGRLCKDYVYGIENVKV